MEGPQQEGSFFDRLSIQKDSPAGHEFSQEYRAVELADLMLVDHPGQNGFCAQQFLYREDPLLTPNLVGDQLGPLS